MMRPIAVVASMIAAMDTKFIFHSPVAALVTLGSAFINYSHAIIQSSAGERRRSSRAPADDLTLRPLAFAAWP